MSFFFCSFSFPSFLGAESSVEMEGRLKGFSGGLNFIS